MAGKKVISIMAVLVMIMFIFTTHSWARQGKSWEESRYLKARSAKNRIYDQQTVQAISATVTGVEKIRPMEGMPYGVHLSVHTGTERLSVHVGPFWFLKERKMDIIYGDKLRITGSRISLQGKEAMIASAITKDGKTLKLRDEDGTPVWSGWRRNYPVTSQ